MNFSGNGALENEVVDIDFANANLGLAASTGGRFYRTTDGGQTWDSIPASTEPDVQVTSVSFVNDTLAYAGTDVAWLLSTTDGGLNWQEDRSSQSFFYPAYHDVHTAVNGTVLAVGSSDIGSVDGGLTSELISNSSWLHQSVPQALYAAESFGDSTLWIAGDSGYMAVNMLPEPVGVSQVSQTELGEFKLHLNPASEEINLSLPYNGPVNYSILTMSGKLLSEGTRLSGQSISVRHYPKGMYLMRIRKNGESSTATLRFVK